LTGGMTLLGVIALMLAPSAARGVDLDLALCAPDQNGFTLTIDNDFFPLPVGRRWVLLGEENGETIGLRKTVLDQEVSFFEGTVTTRVVEEFEWRDANGNGVFDEDDTHLIEISRNYFAQTLGGTVCYFGEAVDIYEGGVVVSHEGSWRADAPGHAPGIFMPAAPKPGMKFQQEVAPGIAEDEAKIVGSGPVTVPAGTFHDTIRLREFNPLDGGKGYKAYTRGVGLIVDDKLVLVSPALGIGRTAWWGAVSPIVIEPADGDALARGTRVTFSWTAVPGAAQYGFEFSGANAAFTNPNGTAPDGTNGLGGAGGGFVVSGTSLTVSVPGDASPGSYQFRIVGLTAAGQPMDQFGDAVTVSVE
jgi:hypothetical protein